VSEIGDRGGRSGARGVRRGWECGGGGLT
jgi:hypothetical protein